MAAESSARTESSGLRRLGTVVMMTPDHNRMVGWKVLTALELTPSRGGTVKANR